MKASIQVGFLFSMLPGYLTLLKQKMSKPGKPHRRQRLLAWDLTRNYYPFPLTFSLCSSNIPARLGAEKQHHVKLKRFINSGKKITGLFSSRSFSSLSGHGEGGWQRQLGDRSQVRVGWTQMCKKPRVSMGQKLSVSQGCREAAEIPAKTASVGNEAGTNITRCMYREHCPGFIWRRFIELMYAMEPGGQS